MSQLSSVSRTNKLNKKLVFTLEYILLSSHRPGMLWYSYNKST